MSHSHPAAIHHTLTCLADCLLKTQLGWTKKQLLKKCLLDELRVSRPSNTSAVSLQRVLKENTIKGFISSSLQITADIKSSVTQKPLNSLTRHSQQLRDPFHSWFDLPHAAQCSWCDRVSVLSFQSLCCLVLWCAWSDVTSLLTPWCFMWNFCFFLTLAMAMPG